MNLRSKDAWSTAKSKRTGEPLADVIQSNCDRFTINRSTVSHGREVFIAWRKRQPPSAPDLIGGYASPELARDACQRYSEKHG